jgi:hypothetical protein
MTEHSASSLERRGRDDCPVVNGHVLRGKTGDRDVRDAGPAQVGDEQDEPESDRRRQPEQRERDASRSLQQPVARDAVLGNES